MEIGVAVVLGLVSLIGTLVGTYTNATNNKFIEDTNEKNREFQEKTNLLNHQWSLEAAQWEYEHEKPQRQYADLLAAGITPAAASQKISGANVSYSPATAVASQNMPKSTGLLNDSLSQVIDEIGNYSSMSQAQASAEKTKAETKVITETSIKKANAEIDKILADTLKSYSDIDVNDSQIDLNSANTDFATEKAETEQVNRRSIEISNEEKSIQLEFTRNTLEMSLKKTEAEIKLLSEQTAKLQEELNGLEFETKYKEWRNTYIETYGVAPEQGWEDTLFKAVIDGKAEPMLDAFTKSLQLIFDSEFQDFQSRSDSFDEKVVRKHFPSIKEWFNRDKDWFTENGFR